MDSTTHYFQQPRVHVAPCALSRDTVADLGDRETSLIEDVTCLDCLVVLSAVTDSLAGKDQHQPFQ